MSAPALRVVAEDGVVPQTIDEAMAIIAQLEDTLAGTERDLRMWRRRYAELARDQEEEAMRNELWAEAEALFGYWRMRCRHPRSKFTYDRFEIARPYLKKYGAELCRRAIDGAAFDPFITRRRNGTQQRHDGWELIFRSADKFEEWVNKAPLEAAS